MKDWRKVVGALCIVLAMVLGAFAGFAYARPGLVGVSPDAGTRGEDRRLLSAFDEMQKVLNPDDVDELVADTAGPESLLGAEQLQITAPGGAVANRVSPEDQRWAFEQAQTLRIENEHGAIEIREQPNVGTRSHYVGGEIDAGGPYGGPDTFEGDTLTITVTIFDPTILFLRYDFDGDGIFDFPDQTGGGSMGKWTTQTTITKVFTDDFFADMVVQGWDGISTTIEINNGDNLGEVDNFTWFIGYGGWNFAWKFRAKADLTVTELGHYHYVYPVYDMGLWDTSGNLLGECMASHSAFSWNWCTLSSSVNLALGDEYLVSLRISQWTTAIDTPADTDKVEFQGTYYCYNDFALCYPNNFWVDFFIPQIDFRWTEVLILPDTTSDTAFIEVNNVAPIVSDVLTEPNPGLEGQATLLSAFFTDPGVDDTWEYRWTFHDGEVSDWQPISKFSGGARVLILHSWTGDIGGIQQNVVEACGTFCVSVDEMDFGPLGENRIPALDELTKYDVLVVGTNWGAIPNSNGFGDRLAEFMDAAGSTGGGIVMMSFGFYNNPIWGIGGRWETEKSPLPRAGSQFFTANLGTIYVPGHPILDGVAAVSALYRQPIFDVNEGATRIADWTDSTVFAGTKVDSGDRIAVGLNYFPSISVGGDYALVIANAIRYASRQPDPVLKTMPIQLDWFSKVYRDDDPTTTTPEDTFMATVEVRDDDHGGLKISQIDPLDFQDFEDASQCSSYYYGTMWPPGWFADPEWGWQCGLNPYYFGSAGAEIFYYYNDFSTSDVYTGSYDLSAYSGARIEFNTWWQGDWPFGTSDGLVEASVDGGGSFEEIFAFHHMDPASYEGPVLVETNLVGGSSDVIFRFRYVSSDDWWWFVDDFAVTGVVGEEILGLGVTEGEVTIANVPPVISGGFDNALRDEAQELLFQGFEVSDPALVEPTEWFAWSVNLDDGTPSDWTYMGSLAPPKLDILIVNTLCLSSTCSDYNGLVNLLLAQDDVGTVDGFNFLNYPFLPSAPSLSLLLQYDVVIVATNWAYISYPPFDLARRQVGDRVAQYIDSGRGGALTFMAVYDLSSFYGDIFSINGRYMDDDYGAFERTEYIFSPQSNLGTIYDPEHDLFVKVGPNVGSMFISPGDMKTTVGGRNNALGRNGVLLADWPNGNSAIGVKELNNGARTAHFGAFGNPTGSDTGMLLRNAVGWVSGGIPSPKVPAFTHTYGDNGIYTVDFSVIDDDMGFTWDAAANEPVEVIPGVEISHRFVEVAVDNVDPTIVRSPGSGGPVEAFIATEFCLRVSGQAGNSVTMNVYADGLLFTTTTVRMTGSPNVPIDKCGLAKVDVIRPQSFSVELTYSAPNGGSNPTWLIIGPWREPVNPGHGTIVIKYDEFKEGGVTFVSTPLPTLKRDLLDSGQGAKIEFVAEAFDVGTDDLAFVWAWGGEGSVIYDATDPDSVYTIHVHHNDGTARSDGDLEQLDLLGFSEPYFDRAANDERSSAGTTNFRVRDTAVHAFPGGQGIYYVFLMVVDDDNGRGYTSDFLRDGMDIEVIVLDLR